MICTNCGSQVQDGISVCPFCGLIFNYNQSTPNGAYNNYPDCNLTYAQPNNVQNGNYSYVQPNNVQNGNYSYIQPNNVQNGNYSYVQPNNIPNGNSFTEQNNQQKKFPTVAIISIIIVILAALGVGTFFIIKAVKNKNESKNEKTIEYAGEYKIDSMVITYQGETMTLSSSELGLTGEEMKIIVDANGNLTIVSDGSEGTGTIKFNGTDVTLSDSDVNIKGKYDKDAKTISISFSEFTKYLLASDLSSQDQQTLDTLNMFDDVVLVFKKK